MGACHICRLDTRPEDLLVCDGCHEMVHTFCKADTLPDGVVPKGSYLWTRGRLWLKLLTSHWDIVVSVQSQTPFVRITRGRT